MENVVKNYINYERRKRKKNIMSWTSPFDKALLLLCMVAALAACSADSSSVDAKSVEEGNDYVLKHVQMYRVLGPQGDTSVWNASNCLVGDSTFSCSRVTNVDCAVFRMSYKKICYDSNKAEIPCLQKDTLYDTTVTDLNFGPNARMAYIPYAIIPEFNRDSVKSLFSELSGETCELLASYSSNYFLEAIGLPDSLTLLKTGEYRLGTYRSDYSRIIGLHSHRDSTGIEKCEISNAEMRITYDQGACFYYSLPNEPKRIEYVLYNNTSRSFSDTTISWKLVYRDEYDRGDTLDVTTKFK